MAEVGCHDRAVLGLVDGGFPGPPIQRCVGSGRGRGARIERSGRLSIQDQYESYVLGASCPEQMDFVARYSVYFCLEGRLVDKILTVRRMAEDGEWVWLTKNMACFYGRTVGRRGW